MSISTNSTFHGCLSFPPGWTWEKHDDTITDSVMCSTSMLRGVFSSSPMKPWGERTVTGFDIPQALSARRITVDLPTP
jgi:hypothetical protein